MSASMAAHYQNVQATVFQYVGVGPLEISSYKNILEGKSSMIGDAGADFSETPAPSPCGSLYFVNKRVIVSRRRLSTVPHLTHFAMVVQISKVREARRQAGIAHAPARAHGPPPPPPFLTWTVCCCCMVLQIECKTITQSYMIFNLDCFIYNTDSSEFDKVTEKLTIFLHPGRHEAFGITPVAESDCIEMIKGFMNQAVYLGACYIKPNGKYAANILILSSQVAITHTCPNMLVDGKQWLLRRGLNLQMAPRSAGIVPLCLTNARKQAFCLFAITTSLRLMLNNTLSDTITRP